jgi:hypothetical protein
MGFRLFFFSPCALLAGIVSYVRVAAGRIVNK